MSEFEIEEILPVIAGKYIERICGNCFFFEEVCRNRESGFGVCNNTSEAEDGTKTFKDMRELGCFYHRTVMEQHALKEVQEEECRHQSKAERLLEKLKDVRQYLPAIIRDEVDKLIEEAEKGRVQTKGDI